MAEFDATRNIIWLMWSINCKLNLSNDMLAITEIDEQVSSYLFETVFDSNDLESFAWLSSICIHKFIKNFYHFLWSIPGGFTS